MYIYIYIYIYICTVRNSCIFVFSFKYIYIYTAPDGFKRSPLHNYKLLFHSNKFSENAIIPFNIIESINFGCI